MTRSQCLACEGQGYVECETCVGKGHVGGFLGVGAKMCTICEGEGRVPCTACHGAGTVESPAPARPATPSRPPQPPPVPPIRAPEPVTAPFFDGEPPAPGSRTPGFIEVGTRPLADRGPEGAPFREVPTRPLAPDRDEGEPRAPAAKRLRPSTGPATARELGPSSEGPSSADARLSKAADPDPCETPSPAVPDGRAETSSTVPPSEADGVVGGSAVAPLTCAPSGTLDLSVEVEAAGFEGTESIEVERIEPEPATDPGAPVDVPRGFVDAPTKLAPLTELEAQGGDEAAESVPEPGEGLRVPSPAHLGLRVPTVRGGSPRAAARAEAPRRDRKRTGRHSRPAAPAPAPAPVPSEEGPAWQEDAPGAVVDPVATEARIGFLDGEVTATVNEAPAFPEPTTPTETPPLEASDLRATPVPPGATIDMALSPGDFPVDPRGWLERALEAAGRPVAEAATLAPWGTRTAACAAYQEARRLLAELVELGRRELVAELAVVTSLEGAELDASGKTAEAAERFDAAIEAMDRLHGAGLCRLLPHLARALSARALVAEAQADLAWAVELHTRAVEAWLDLLAAGTLGVEGDVARALMNLAVAHDQLGHHQDAADAYGRAADLLQRLVDAGEMELEDDLARAYMNQGVAHEQLGDLARAAELYGRAIAIWEPLVGSSDAPDVAGNLGWTLAYRAGAVDLLGEAELARSLARRAVALLDGEVVRTGRSDLEDVLSWARTELAHLLD